MDNCIIIHSYLYLYIYKIVYTSNICGRHMLHSWNKRYQKSKCMILIKRAFNNISYGRCKVRHYTV